MKKSIVLVMSLLALAGRAQAEGDVQHQWSVTWSPLHVFMPALQVTAERRVLDDLGVALVAGGGRMSLDDALRATLFEAGAQVRYYLLGSFVHGLQLGAEVQYQHTKVDQPLPADVVSLRVGGLSAGAFLGYKIAANMGFTFELQAGAQHLLLLPPAIGPGPHGVDVPRTIPLLNLNVGWSF